MGWRRWYNACDWEDCSTCPHKDCISDEELAEKRFAEFKKIASRCGKKRYHSRKEKGLCVGCGRKPHEVGSIYCFECRAYHRKALSAYQKRNYILKVRNPELCYRCRARPRVYGKKLCTHCLESAELSCLKARVRRRQNRFLRFWFLLKLILGENNNVFRLV